MPRDKVLPDGDYIAEDGLWLTIGGLSVRVQRDGAAVSIEVYPVDCEMDEPLDSIVVQTP